MVFWLVHFAHNLEVMDYETGSFYRQALKCKIWAKQEIRRSRIIKTISLQNVFP